jgi:hypothetical protein
MPGRTGCIKGAGVLTLARAYCMACQLLPETAADDRTWWTWQCRMTQVVDLATSYDARGRDACSEDALMGEHMHGRMC